MSLSLVQDSRHRPLKTIAREICQDWQKMSPYARPYVDALLTLDQIEDNYHLDTGSYIVNYFLANAQSWRGEKAKAIKLELKTILKSCDEKLSHKNQKKAYAQD